VPQFTKFLKFDNEKKYPALAPILYPGLKKQDRDIFWTEILAMVHRLSFFLARIIHWTSKILKVILFGKTSLEARLKPNVNNTVGQLWGVTSVTASSVAFSCLMVRVPSLIRAGYSCNVQARYLVSPDTELALIGARSKIPYLRDFRRYKKILITQADTELVKKIFRFFNKIVFSNVRDNSAITQDDLSDHDSDDIDAAMRQLGLDEATNEELGGQQDNSELLTDRLRK
jgi:hypothetical protein